MLLKMTFSVLLSIFVTVAAHADVVIIKSKIEGQGFKTVGNTVNILYPHIILGQEKIPLFTGQITAISACQMLGMKYLNYSQGDSGVNRRLVRLPEGAPIEFIQSSRYMAVLSCDLGQ